MTAVRKRRGIEGDASFEGIAFKKGGIVTVWNETQGLFLAQAAIVFDTEFDQHGTLLCRFCDSPAKASSLPDTFT